MLRFMASPLFGLVYRDEGGYHAGAPLDIAAHHLRNLEFLCVVEKIAREQDGDDYAELPLPAS